MNRGNFPYRKQQKREGSQARMEARAKRSDQEQLDLLVYRGHGHCKEADKLREKIKE